ncbi:MAG: Tn3 family transposase, partial [Rubrobacter sp.]|nr:Tn3 family transposase [Rubrobacter sp.]
GTIDAALIGEQWDQLVRIASSLRQRTAPAHVVVQRLAGSAPSDRVAKALTALGRAVKTISVLRYPMFGVTPTGPGAPRARKRLVFQALHAEWPPGGPESVVTIDTDSSGDIPENSLEYP